MLYHRRSHPYQRNATKRNTERSSVANLTAEQTRNEKEPLQTNLVVTPSHQQSRNNGNPLSSHSQSVSKIGKYILLDGNPGSSFTRVIDCQNRAQLACKIVEAKKLGDVMAPYRHLASHENINEIVDVIVGENKAYVFMQRSYGDLHSYVRTKKRLKENEASKLFVQIVRAVSHCHRSGIVLRDLKLRKFVFKNKDRTELKLECLEDACVLEGANDTLEDKHGCPAYVSPELLHCSGGYSGKLADVWSLGVMLYTMLVGRYPFQDIEPTVLFSKIRRGHFVIPDSLSSKAKCLVRSMMRQEPSQRLNAEELLDHPWFKSTFHPVSSFRVDKRTPDQTVPSVNVDESYFLPVKSGPSL